MSSHTTLARRSQTTPPPSIPPMPTHTVVRRDDEEGSLVTEYGLLAMVAATIAGIVIKWAEGGAVAELFNSLLSAARGLVNA